MIVIGLTHLLYVVVVKSGPLAAIVRGGIVNAVEPHPEREAAIWSLWFGVFVVTTGAVMAKMQAHQQPVPAIAGQARLAMGLIGGILMPVSGLRAGIPLALFVLLPERRKLGRQRDRAIGEATGGQDSRSTTSIPAPLHPITQSRRAGEIRHLSVGPSQRLHIWGLPSETEGGSAPGEHAGQSAKKESERQ